MTPFGTDRFAPGQALKLALAERGTPTQKALAQAVGVHESKISLLVNGKLIPGEDLMAAIAAELGRERDVVFPEWARRAAA